jgi:hypothetical protein
VKPLKAKLTALGKRHIRQNGGKMAEKWRRVEDIYDYSGLYRFSKISSEIPKVGISGCRKKRSLNGTFF